MTWVLGGDVVLPDRVVRGGRVVVEGTTVVAVHEAAVGPPPAARTIDAAGCLVLPGFVDVHVHGLLGVDTLDPGAPVSAIAERLPQFGVTAFCPTSVACGPDTLSTFLRSVSGARSMRNGARVLGAHLESNFINPAFAGAQPLSCLRHPPATSEVDPPGEPFLASDVLKIMTGHSADVGIVTLAPELPRALDLVQRLTAAGHIVSIGHTGADYETTRAAIAAGARHATHLFNRMPPLSHRAPGAVGALLEAPEVSVELIVDGVHVHPSLCRMAIAAKGARGVMAITDATAGSGLPAGSQARLGGRTIRVTDRAAELEDGTLAGSTATMNRVFETLVSACGVSLVDAATMCSTTPARQMRQRGLGAIAVGGPADLVVLDASYSVRCTMVAGTVVYASAG